MAIAHFSPGPVLALALVLASGCASAQQGATALPAPLQGMQRAGESCSRNDDQPRQQPPGAAKSAEALAPDLSCAMAMGEARTALGAGTFTVVDVRAASDYQRFHAPDALNLPMQDLPYKQVLKAKPLLLVGTGKGERELYVACGRLRRAGFASVRVLSGGMLSYVRSALPLQGRAPGAYEMAQLSAGELWEEARSSENVVLVSEGNRELLGQLPYAAVVAGMTPATLQSVMEQQRKAGGRPPLSLVLAAPVPADAYGALAAAVAPTPLTVYPGPPEAVSKHAQTQKAMWAAHARGPRQPRCG